MIDLHTHTTASDGRCSPDELVRRAHAAGVDTLAVTDHDTVSACAAVAAACAARGVHFVPGIEITAVLDGADVHVLGYFIDPDSSALEGFLAEQRQRRVDRVREMISKLVPHGIVLDVDAILKPGLEDSRKSAGRPWIARALVAEGHVPNVAEAFNRWLSRDRPAFVPRLGASPEAVFAHIHEAGGLASLAHPVLAGRDELIAGYADAGLDALEAYHSDHDTATTMHYLAMARSLGLGVSGGSDYHGDDAHGGGPPGKVALPREHYDGLHRLLAARRATASGSSTSS